MNYWFFLLSEGDNGTNHNNDCYDVTPIGINDASQIVYRAHTEYFTNSTNFSNARTLTIQSAIDIFGANSQEVITTTNAWFAVGVGEPYNGYQITGPSALCQTDKTYSIDVPAGATINWSVDPVELFTIDNGTGTSFTTAGSLGASGQGTITAEVSIGCIIVEMPKIVYVGVPDIDISSIDLVPGGIYTPLPESCIYDYDTRYSVQVTGWPQGATSTDWDGLVGRLYKDSWSTASFYPLPNDTYYYGSGYVEFKSSNSCGQAPSLVIGYGPCYPGGGLYSYSMFPNPTSDELNISFTEGKNIDPSMVSSNKKNESRKPSSVVVNILNHQMETVLSENGNTEKDLRVNTSSLKPGYYIVHINIDGNIHRHHLVIE